MTKVKDHFPGHVRLYNSLITPWMEIYHQFSTLLAPYKFRYCFTCNKLLKRGKYQCNSACILSAITLSALQHTPSNSHPTSTIPTSPTDTISFTEIFSTIIPTSNYIPKQCLAPVATAITTLLTNCSTHKSPQSFYSLLLFAKTILYRFPGNKLDSGRFAARILGDIPKFLESLDSQVQMFRQVKSHFPQPSVSERQAIDVSAPSPTVSKGQITRATMLAASHDLPKALKALMPQPTAPHHPVTLDKLLALHPIMLDPVQQIPIPSPITPDPISEDVILNHYSSASISSPAGPDGFHPNITKSLLFMSNDDIRTPLRDALTSFITLLDSGTLPLNISTHFYGGSLTAFIKNWSSELQLEDMQIRPIVIGCSWQRAHCASRTTLSIPAIKSSLHQSQLGLQRAGSETIQHAVQFLFSHYPFSATHRKVYLQVDVKAAFQSISRNAIRNALLQMCPSAIPFFNTAYSQPTVLHYLDSSLESSFGVRQGSSESGAFWAAGFNAFLEGLAARFPTLDLNAWFFDDGNIIGDIETVAECLQYILTELPKYGPTLNLLKCSVGWLTPPSGTNVTHYHSLLRQYFPQLQHPRHQFPSGIFPSSGVQVLGVFIGSPDATQDWCSSKLNSLNSLHSKVLHLHHSQLQLALLRSSLSFTKINHLLRALPIVPNAAQFDELFRSFVDQSLRSSLSDTQWHQAQFPTYLGGLDVRSIPVLAPCAYLASRLLTSPLLARTLPSFTIQQLLADISTSPLLEYSPVQPATINIDTTIPRQLQRSITRGNYLSIFNILTPTLTEIDRMRRTSYNTPWANRWLHCPIDVRRNTLMSDAQFRISCYLRLGVAIFPIDATCSACHSPMDVHGYHALHCISLVDNVSSRYWRHNQIATAIHRLAAFAHLSPRLNVPDLIPSKSADIYLRNFHRGRHVVCDVTVGNHLAPSSLDRFLSSDIETFLLLYHHNRKLESPSGQLFAQLPLTDFRPLVFSSLGHVHSSTRKFLQLLSTHHSRISGYSYSLAVQYVADYVVFAVMKSSASMVLSRLVSDPLLL
jgi:hypothetical protein